MGLTRFIRMCVLLGSVMGAVSSTAAQDNVPPEGFVALFNGQNLSGWHGMASVDPRKLSAMTDEERTAKIAADLEDVKQHWSVDNGDLVNDGHGVYLTTDKDYGEDRRAHV